MCAYILFVVWTQIVNWKPETIVISFKFIAHTKLNWFEHFPLDFLHFLPRRCSRYQWDEITEEKYRKLAIKTKWRKNTRNLPRRKTKKRKQREICRVIQEKKTLNWWQIVWCKNVLTSTHVLLKEQVIVERKTTKTKYCLFFLFFFCSLSSLDAASFDNWIQCVCACV